MTPECAGLPAIAIDAVRETLVTGRRALPDERSLSPALRVVGTSFVSLERDGALLGCVGTLAPVRPLGVDVAHNARAAAFEDPRLPPLAPDDFPVMSVKVSVLSDLRPSTASSWEDLAAGVHPAVDGVVVEAAERRATFLPAVWAAVAGVEEFLDALWAKAGIAPGWWSTALRTWTYTTIDVADPGPRAPAHTLRVVPPG
jgi:uncharacterized protein